MAEIEHFAFAASVIRALGEAGLSYERAVEKWPELDKAMLSRACNARTLSAGNFLLVCRCLALDPYQYLNVEARKRLTMKDVLKQAVTAGFTRETSL